MIALLLVSAWIFWQLVWKIILQDDPCWTLARRRHLPGFQFTTEKFSSSDHKHGLGFGDSTILPSEIIYLAIAERSHHISSFF
jgi:hypothetical protein